MCGSGGAGSSRPRGKKALEQRLLRMEAVLGLVPDGGTLAVEEVLGDLLAGVSGKAMEHDRALGCRREQLRVHLVGSEIGAPPRALGLVAHAHPHVGVDGVGTLG